MSHLESSTALLTGAGEESQRESSADDQNDEQKQASVIMNPSVQLPEIYPSSSSSPSLHAVHNECCASGSLQEDTQSTPKMPAEMGSQSDIRAVKQYESQGRIKRPMNAFMVWSQMRRAQIASKDIKMHNSQISKELGAEWRKMSSEEKAPYVKRAKELREDLMRRHPNYVYRPKRKTQANSKIIRAPPCSTIPSSCQPTQTQQRSRAGAPYPSIQDVSNQLFLARVAQEQHNNMLLAAYRNQLMAAASTTALKNTTKVESVDQDKQRSATMSGVPLVNNISPGAEPFRFLTSVPMLQNQYSALNPILGPQFLPFLFGQQHSETTTSPPTLPVAVQK